MSRVQGVAMDFFGAEKGAKANNGRDSSPAKRVELLMNERANTHGLSWIKPEMMQQVLSFRGFSDENRADQLHHGGAERPSHMDPYARDPVGVFPQHLVLGSIPTTKYHINPFSSLGQESAPPLLPKQMPSSGRSPVQGVYPTTNAPSRSSAAAGKQQSSQLTIFYNGTVNVYDVPADKAQAIMMLAGNTGFHPANPAGFDSLTRCTPSSGSASSSFMSKATAQSTSTNEKPDAPPPSKPSPEAVTQHQQQPIRKVNSALPIARKQSLQRFLEKRKDRLSSVTPYTTKDTLSKSGTYDEKERPKVVTSASFEMVNSVGVGFSPGQ